MIFDEFSDLDVVFCRDLAEITHDPSAVYQLFIKYQQQEFANNQRLIFFTNHNITDKLWQHLYQAANDIDISNYFICIAHCNDISDAAKSAAKKWSIDPIPFQTKKISHCETLPLASSFVLSDYICPLPWTHIEVRNNGEISPCCIHQGTVGNVKTHTLDEIFRGREFENLRKDFRAGKQPLGCNACWHNEQKGTISHRQRHLAMLRNDLLGKYLNDPQIISLDLKPGNTCNFKCRICGPIASSQWAQEMHQTAKTQSIKKSTNWIEDGIKVFDDIQNHVSNLTNLDLYGGEPFLIKPLKSLIQNIITQKQAHHIRLHYNSNGSVWPGELLPLWEEFLHVDIHFSIDNIGLKFELERGGSWQKVNDNISRLKSLSLPNMKISIMPVISIMNVLDIGDVIAWAESLDLPVNATYLQRPQAFSLNNITKIARDAVIAKYQNSTNPELIRICHVVNTANYSNGNEFNKTTARFDSIRKQNFCITHPEIASLMGYTNT